MPNESPKEQAMREMEQHVATVRADTRKRKKWAVISLESLLDWAKEHDVEGLSGSAVVATRDNWETMTPEESAEIVRQEKTTHLALLWDDKPAGTLVLRKPAKDGEQELFAVWNGKEEEDPDESEKPAGF